MMPSAVLASIVLAIAPTLQTGQSIDRHALVTRHNVTINRFDTENPLSVGNGEFAFTADCTGLQTFHEAFNKTIPLCTMAQWGWHTFPNPEGWHIDKLELVKYPDLNGRLVGYVDIPGNRQTPQIRWLRANPHRLHLGRIGFVLTRPNGSLVEPNDLEGVNQTLDLWNGRLVSRFSVGEAPVTVRTVCHPSMDLLAVKVESSLIGNGRLSICIEFPYGSDQPTAADWSKPDAHQSILIMHGPNTAKILRRLDDDRYYVRLAWAEGCQIRSTNRHTFILQGSSGQGQMELVCHFSPMDANVPLPTFDQTIAAATRHWNGFWQDGGAIDLSESTDQRWRELERRIVLSQYLTAIQSAGSLPPQETGLTYNSWYGKFHLEMHWWHAAHFALWGRLPLLERSLGYYKSILPKAKATAMRQGYKVARWPKMTCPSGDESPSTVGPFLIWQQPHPIFYAELVYRQRQDRATVEAFKDIVFETAQFMASYATWDKATSRYVLGPTLQCAQEIFPKEKTINPTFELTYWRWGLQVAQTWRQRLGLDRDPVIDQVLDGLAMPPIAGGRYLFTETTPDCYRDPRWAKDHPSVLAALGMLPGPGIDRSIMQGTLDWIWQHWDWADTWGWDYPMIAMTAARLGQPERAVDALLMDTPKNRYRLNGHNHQRPGLTIYLPGNGGLLYAVAMMAAGWDGGPTRHAPGFPDNGQWVVRYEGLYPAP